MYGLTCADQESFVRGGQLNSIYFQFLRREGPNHAQIKKVLSEGSIFCGMRGGRIQIQL